MQSTRRGALQADVKEGDPFARTGEQRRIAFSGSKLAVIGDIHGNLPALDAALYDARRRGADLVVSTGDIVGYGPWPQECIDLLVEAAVPTIQGNYDRGVGEGLDNCGCAYRTDREQATGQVSLAWTSRAVTPAGRGWLRDLPFELEVTAPDGHPLVSVFHGSPRRISEYLYADRPVEGVSRMLADQPAPVVVCGHTHLPYVRALPGNRMLVNCGSAGRPRHGRPVAVYVMLDWGNRQGNEAGLEQRAAARAHLIEVPYETGRAANAVLASGLPGDFAVLLRTGQGD